VLAGRALISTGFTSCRCASDRWRKTSRGSNRRGAIFPSFSIGAFQWETIDHALEGLRIPELVDWRVREVFRDAKLGANDYSLLLGATFQAQDRTLRDEELQGFQQRVVEAVGKAGARLRS
jgi:hypothetical protein